MAKKTVLEQRIEELDKLHAKGVVNDEEYQERRAAIVNDTSAPEKKSRGGIMKWGAFGCLGIFAVIGIAVIGVIVIIAVALGSAADGTKDSGGDVHASLREGSSGVISPSGNGSKKSKVTILKIADNAASSNQFSQPANGKKYYAVQVEVENVGTKEVSSLDWKVRDSKDGETSRTFVSGIGENLEPFYDLTPGGKAQGWVVFEIAADASPKWIRADPNPFLKDDLYFDVQ